MVVDVVWEVVFWCFLIEIVEYGVVFDGVGDIEIYFYLSWIFDVVVICLGFLRRFEVGDGGGYEECWIYELSIIIDIGCLFLEVVFCWVGFVWIWV